MSFCLVTGGAGFIGSHLAEALVHQGDGVRVLDNFSTGKEENIDFATALRLLPDRFALVKGDIRNFETCKKACAGVDFVFHQAALGSVPRSVEDPLTTNEVNIQGTLNMLIAARDARVKRFIYASSSSVYGDRLPAPGEETPQPAKAESQMPQPQSPYAVSKLTGEYYCRVFYKIYNLETVSLRYFNVFGQRQDANSTYAAVIPRFITALLHDRPPTIYGDGLQSRDFTHVDNVVHANIRACSTPGASGGAFNIACGERTTLIELYSRLVTLTGRTIKPLYAPSRAGDVKHSCADVTRAAQVLSYRPGTTLGEGLQKTTTWFANQLNKTGENSTGCGL
jgi:nucleoside-diphosphate-sugar epimerase